MRSFGINDCIYAHLKGGGYSKLYVQVGSQAYNYLIDMGVSFLNLFYEADFVKHWDSLNQVSLLVKFVHYTSYWNV